MKLPKAMRSVVLPVVVAYLANALLIAGTEQLLVRVFSGAKYLVADVVAQSVIQVGCGYLCSRISNAMSRPAIVSLIAIGLLVGGFSLTASWHADPHWYGIALILVYGPCGMDWIPDGAWPRGTYNNKITNDGVSS